jgi:predicted HicB family RNase H-like nuclease
MTEPRKPPQEHDALQPADTTQQTEGRRPGRPREIQYSLEKKFTLLLPKDVHKALKVKSAELELPMTTMIIDAIKKAYGI